MIDLKSQSRTVLAHDWLVGLRGGEHVLDRIARIVGPTTLYTLVSDGRFLTDSIDVCEIVTSPLQRFPGAAGRLRRHYLPLYPWAVERLRVQPCDLIISTSSAVMKSILPPAGAVHLCYCHSPARYIWEQTEDYRLGRGGQMRGVGLNLLKRRFQRWDRATADRVHQFLANSRHTAERIRRCYRREAVVVHPPVRTGFFTLDANVPREDWMLVVAALEPYKRTDLVIDAANRARFPLRVVGGGTQLKALRRLAGPTVELLGRVGDEALRDLYRRARALIFPQVEDFGIICVEAQACGCPVIAYAAGGALDVVTEESGLLMLSQSADAILEARQRLLDHRFDPNACRENAERFSEERFDTAMRREIERVLEASAAGFT